MLARFELNFYGALARNEILSRRGSSFQDFFVEVGHHSWAPDFEGRRPQGRIGDKKCDGYRPSSQTVFQCYGPREMRPPVLVAKIEDDYRGAVNNHQHTPIKHWVLVHNDFEDLPTTAHEKVIELRNEDGAVPIDIWGPLALLTLVMGLPREKLALLFPNGLDADDLRKIQYRDIDDLIQGLGDPSYDPSIANVDAPTSKKIMHNNFSEEVTGILKAGYLVQRRFTEYFADTSRAEVGNRLASNFKRIYASKRDAGLEADQIFFALTDAVGGLACEKPRRAAIIGLVTYMFHTCEIFEDVPKQ